MKIQVVSEFYYPDNFKSNDIVAALVAAGHEVEVLTALPDYETGRVPERYKGFKNRTELIFGAKTVRIHTTERREGTLRRVLNYATFMVNSFFYALFCKKPSCDAIFVYESSPIFQVLPAVIFKKRTGKKLVMYCCDLWPESLKAWGVGEESFLYKRVAAFSGWLCRKCDVIAITSKPFREYLRTVCGVEDEKIVYLPQPCKDEFGNNGAAYKENGCVDFMFAGNIGAVQNVDCVIEAAARVQTENRFCVHIVGDGSELSGLKAQTEALGVTDRVVFHGRHPADKMKDFYELADCFLLTLRGGDFIGKTLPGKSQGYLSAGKPVLAAAGEAVEDMLAEAGCGVSVSQGDANALARAMEELICNFDSYRQMGADGRRFYEANYTDSIFLRRLLEILE